jgi:hypothetical protein
MKLAQGDIKSNRHCPEKKAFFNYFLQISHASNTPAFENWGDEV